MAKTNLDQLVEFPAKIIKNISEDKQCVGMIVNKSFNDVTEEDSDKVIDDNLFDYQYVDFTTPEGNIYVWVEMEVNSVKNNQIQNGKVYVIVACHKNYMKLKTSLFKGIVGNRRDNLIAYIDKLLNDTSFYGVGKLKLEAVRSLAPINGFTARELIYSYSDFNTVK